MTTTFRQRIHFDTNSVYNDDEEQLVASNIPSIQNQNEGKQIYNKGKSAIITNGKASSLLNLIRFELSSRQLFLFCLVVLTILSFATRFFAIERGNTVTWDEAHFGKFASHYLKHEFYTDVHPPLGKIIISLAGYLNGYNGTWDFKSATEYPDWVNYVGMRMILASFGALAVPFALMTAVALDLSQPACFLIAVCMLFDNGFIGISRLILLDSMLLCFTVTSTFGLALSIRYRNEPFSTKWWASMLFTGINIGIVSSVKWVGLFGVALVGLHAVQDLARLVGDIRISKIYVAKHLGARVICLIFVPVGIYIFSFFLHFSILTHSGPGDAVMGSLFQAGLIGNDIAKNPYEVAFGSTVTLRNRAVGGGLLHSHIQTYPSGSKQQQVTGYGHKDINNEFIIKVPHDHQSEAISENETGPIIFLRDGDTVRLVHTATNRNLHSHRIPAPMTKGDFEVSAYGNDTLYNDPNDHWTVELIEDESDRVNDQRRIRSLSSVFKLRHVVTGCYLSSSKNTFPDWGFKQIEVSCQPNDNTNRNILWNVETHKNDLLPSGESGLYRSSFWKNVMDVNVNMWRTNNALVPDAELERSALVSDASEWPFLLTGIRMTSFNDNVVKFYMAGNPLIWWITGLSVIIVALGLFGMALAWKRQLVFPLLPNISITQLFLRQAQVALGGWILHYIPFYVMGRVLYLHHYYPALFFAILTFGILFDRLMFPFGISTIGKNQFSPGYILVGWNRRTVLSVLLLSIPIIYTFVLFMPICYGHAGPSKELDHLRWVSSWPL